jgi:hypothetical protein
VPAGCIVLDPDPRKGGTVAALEEANGGPLPKTLTTWTGRNDGGCHLYFIRPAGRLTSTRLPKGVDLKANGYVIVPRAFIPQQVSRTAGNITLLHRCRTRCGNCCGQLCDPPEPTDAAAAKRLLA